MDIDKDKISGRIEPTKAEVEILTVLWEYGPSTVRFVNEKLNASREIAYTSTLKIMQLMAEKGILKRDESQMKHVYHVVEGENEIKGLLVKKFVDLVFKGSASKLVMQILGNRKSTDSEIQELKEVLKHLDDD